MAIITVFLLKGKGQNRKYATFIFRFLPLGLKIVCSKATKLFLINSFIHPELLVRNCKSVEGKVV